MEETETTTSELVQQLGALHNIMQELTDQLDKTQRFEKETRSIQDSWIPRVTGLEGDMNSLRQRVNVLATAQAAHERQMEVLAKAQAAHGRVFTRAAEDFQRTMRAFESHVDSHGVLRQRVEAIEEKAQSGGKKRRRRKRRTKGKQRTGEKRTR